MADTTSEAAADLPPLPEQRLTPEMGLYRALIVTYQEGYTAEQFWERLLEQRELLGGALVKLKEDRPTADRFCVALRTIVPLLIAIRTEPEAEEILRSSILDRIRALLIIPQLTPRELLLQLIDPSLLHIERLQYFVAALSEGLALSHSPSDTLRTFHSLLSEAQRALSLIDKELQRRALEDALAIARRHPLVEVAESSITENSFTIRLKNEPVDRAFARGGNSLTPLELERITTIVAFTLAAEIQQQLGSGVDVRPSGSTIHAIAQMKL